MFGCVYVVSPNYFLYLLQKIMVMLRTSKQVFIKQQKDRVETSIDNLVNLSHEFNIHGDDLIIFVGWGSINHKEEVYGFTIYIT